MSGEADIAVPARAMGDPARGRMLVALLGGRALPAGELARIAGLSSSTTSEHLRLLAAAGVVAVERQGRHRYVRLASPDVAHAIEALQAIAPVGEVVSLRQHRASRQLRGGRTCYDHLAGDLGLRVADLLRRYGVVRRFDTGDACPAPSPFPDNPLVRTLELRPASGRRPWVRGCLDWTGRRPHAGGQVGAQVLAGMDARSWVVRRPDSRAVQLTPAGERSLDRLERGPGWSDPDEEGRAT